MCEKNCMDEKLANEMKELLKNYSQDKSNLIQILNEVQEKYGYIPKQSQIEISVIFDSCNHWAWVWARHHFLNEAINNKC